MATAAEVSEIIKLYVGYYNRAPDPAGLNFWINAFDGGFDLDAMAVDFSTQPETLQNYPFFLNPTPSVADYGSFVDAVYGNLFNRAPDAAGREFWSTKIASGEFSVGEAISLIIAGATTSPDQDVVANKVAVGRDFFIKANAQPTYTFDNDDIQTATAIQASVTDDPASVTAAQASTDAYIAGLNAATISLTTGTDQPGGGSGVNTQGSAGNDIYTATIEFNFNNGSEIGTLQSADTIAASGGDDILNVRVISNVGFVVPVSPVATGLEQIVVTDQSTFSGFFAVDFTNIEGETHVTAKDGIAVSRLGFSNVDEGTVARMENHDGFFAMNYKGDRSASSNDSFDVYIEDSGTETQSAVFFLSDNQFNNSDTSFEMVNVESGGSDSSFLDLFALQVDGITATGDQALNIEETNTNFATLNMADASGMTGGGLNLNASGSTQTDFAFTGSGFDDGVFLSNSLLNGTNTLALNGGDGSDTLVVNNFTNLSASTVNAADNFEILRSDSSSTSLQADDFNDINIFEFDGQTTSGNRLNIRGVEDDDRFVFLTDAGRTDEFIRFEADRAGTDLTFELRANSATGGQVELVASGNNNSSSAIGFQGNQISEVNIVSSGTNSEANLIRSIDGGSGNFFAFGNASGPSSFNITGGQALTITAERGVSLTASDDERGFEESVNLDGSGATGNLRIAGSGTADVIQGGSGNDILYGLGGDDALTGNDGNDQFRISDWSGTDTIEDFTSGDDVIGLLDGSFNNTTATQAGATVSASDYVENLSTIANMSTGEDNKIVELQLAASEAQITGTLADAFDVFVMVLNSTSGRGELWFDNDWNTAGNRSMVVEFDTITDLAGVTGLSNTDFVEYIF
ncbi:MAG: DUF4214 domain-containing protein [Sulfitobacter sp.]|nr:DUF4214 domain-containing protein [Sulfitobacter sp.]